MGSRCSVIQYVPNPIANERINIGVLVFNDNLVKVHFLSSWERVSHFSCGQDIRSLKEFAQQMEAAAAQNLLFPGDQENEQPRHERLLKVSQDWMNSIQFTKPRYSLENVHNLYEYAVQEYLWEPKSESIVPSKKIVVLQEIEIIQSASRNRQIAASITKSHVKKILTQTGNEEIMRKLFQPSYRIRGKKDQYKFDATVANGQPYLTAHGVSFEVKTREDFLYNLAWKIEDVKRNNPDFPIGLVAIPPHPEQSEEYHQKYTKMTKTYGDLGAEVLSETQVDQWLRQHLQKIPELTAEL